MKVAYFVSRYPQPCQTFVQREIRGVIAAGVCVTVFPIVSPRRRVRTSAGARGALPVEVIYTQGLSAGCIRWALYYLGRQPETCLRLLGMIIRDTWRRPLDLAKSLVSFHKSFALAAAVRAMDCDHIHAHWSSHPATAAMVVSKLTGIPFSFAFHAYDLFATRILLRRKLREASLAVLNCRHNWDYLLRLYPDTDTRKLVLLYNGLDLERFGKQARLGDKARPLLLVIGRLVASKGFDCFIEACRLLAEDGRSFRGVIIGDGPEKARLRSLVRKHGLEDSVELLGEKPVEAVLGYLGQAALLAVPCVQPRRGSHDALPNVIMEAQAARVPVVASNLFGIPEIVKHDVTGLLVPPGEPRALKLAMARLLDDAALGPRLAARARQELAREFDIHANGARLAALFSAGPQSARREHERPMTWTA